MSGPKPSPWRRDGEVERLLHDAGPDAHAPRGDVDLGDRVHVARGVEHEPLAGGLPGEARAGAAGDDRDLEARGGRTAAATSAASRGNATSSGALAYMLASPA